MQPSNDIVPIQSSGIGATLQALTARLDFLGYAEFCASFNPLSPRLDRWVELTDKAPTRLQPLLSLFLLGDTVALEETRCLLGGIVQPLVDAGLICHLPNNMVALPNLILLPIASHWLFVQRPQVNPTLYFGDDSMALMLRIRPRHTDRCLDLCAGPGIQSLQCASTAQHVTAVEVNPVAAELARLNVIMNQRSGRIDVVCGSLYSAVRNQRFDLIVANPPLLPFPEDQPYPFVGHGGFDGLRVTRRILNGLPEALTTGGRAQLIGTCLSNGSRPLCDGDLTRIAASADCDILMTIVSHKELRPGTPYFDGLVFTASSRVKDGSQVATALEAHLSGLGATHLASYFLHVEQGRGSLAIQDLSSAGSEGLWYV